MNAALKRAEEALKSIRSAGLYRTLIPPVGIDCSSNDYLGLHNHPAIVEAAGRALQIHGFGGTASRLLRGDRALTHDVEAQMASFKQTGSALYFHTGYAANLGLLQSVIQKDDLVFSDRYNHASLIDGIKMSRARCTIFEHLNTDQLQSLFRESPKGVIRWLVTESLFSMDGDAAPLDQYAELCARHQVGLIVDEAHAIGLYGKRRSGLIEHFAAEEAVFASTNAMGKAFGCFGSFVCAQETVIDYLIQKARTLIFSTASPPCMIAAIGASLSIIQETAHLQQQLFHNIQRMSELLLEAGLMTQRAVPSPIFPIVIGDNKRTLHLAQHLQAQGYDVRAIRPPTVPPDTARLRVVIHAHMGTEQIEGLVKAIRLALGGR